MLRHAMVGVAALALGAHPSFISGQTLAHRLVRDMVAKHPDVLSAMELAVPSGDTCATVESTDPKDVGEKCDADQKEPIRAKQVEHSTR